MARSVVVVTTEWVEVSVVPVTITVSKVNAGPEVTGSKLWINDSPTDEGILILTPDEKGSQIFVTDERSTFIRATVDGWEVTLDE